MSCCTLIFYSVYVMMSGRNSCWIITPLKMIDGPLYLINCIQYSTNVVKNIRNITI